MNTALFRWNSPKRRPKIKTALTSVFLLIAIIFCTLAGYAVNRLGVYSQNVGEVAADWLPSTLYSKDMDIALSSHFCRPMGRVIFPFALIHLGVRPSDDALDRFPNSLVAMPNDMRRGALE